MFQSFFCDARAFFSLVVRLKGAVFALAKAADTFNRSCSASISANLSFLMADYIAVMRSPISTCSGAKFSPLARTAFSGLFLTHFSCMSHLLCCWCPYSSRWELLIFASCLDVPVMFGIVIYAIPYVYCVAMLVPSQQTWYTFSMTLLGSSDVSSSERLVSATMVKWICRTLLLSSCFWALWRILVAL